MTLVFFFLKGEGMKEATRTKWANIVQECDKSGLNAKQWCREKSVCYPMFLQWRKKFRESNQIPSFIEIKSEPAIEIKCGGVEIKLFAPNDLKTLKDLLRALC